MHSIMIGPEDGKEPGAAYVLASSRVHQVFTECLAGGRDASGIRVRGVVSSATFSTEAIREHRGEIARMLAELPEEFRKSGGGGWIFVNACHDRYGRQWTGFHADMEQLFMVGIAAGLVTELTTPEMRDYLPGRMPFYRVEM